MGHKTLMTMALLVIVGLLIGAVAGYGLKAPEKSADVVVQAGTVPSYNVTASSTAVTAHVCHELIVSLGESPSTGYLWNVSATPGLTVLGDWFIPDNATLLGSPGVHEWMVLTTGAGAQSFQATLIGPNQTAVETAGYYKLTINVS